MAKLTKVGSVDEFDTCSVKRIEVDGLAIAVVRIDDDFFAVGDRCSHQDVSLSEGELFCEDREIECYKHGSTFSLTDGSPQSLPATKPVPTFEVSVAEGHVWIAVP